jgi:hypothetical protein
MTRFRAVAGLAAALSLTGAAVAMLPAQAALAASHVLWVSSAAPVGGGTGLNCDKPGYNTIQSAINAAPPGGTIDICGGTYSGQLQITSSVTLDSVQGKATVQLPAVPAADTTTCDADINTQYSVSDQDGISVCGDVTANMRGIIVNAAWPGDTCSDALYGLMIGGGATVNFADSSVTAAGAVPLNGCQGGVGIEAGVTASSPAQTGQVGHLDLTDSAVSGYQKNGITIDGAGSTATIDNATVTGIGQTTEIAQNGIQVSDGATAQITSSRVTADECNYPGGVCGPNGLTQTQSAAVLLYGAGAGTTVSHSELTDSDMGIYYVADPSASPPASPTATFSSDTFTDDRYESVLFDQGDATLTDSTMTGGDVGIEAIQYSAQTFGVDSTVSDVKATHMSEASVEALSDLGAGDPRGTLTVEGSLISTGHLLNNNPGNFTIIRTGDR